MGRHRVPDWFLDEAAHAGPEHLSADYARYYDRKAGFDPTDDVNLLLQQGLGPSDTLIDFGAGTGRLAMAAAGRSRRVVAVDPSSAMTAALENSVRAARVNNIAVIRAGFLTYTHEGQAAAAVYSRNALHHLPDFWKAIALSRIFDILRPDGVLFLRDIVYSFEAAETETVIESWIASGAASSAQGWTPEELAEHVRSEHSTFSWLLEPMIDRAGFVIEDVSHSESKVFSAYTCRRP